MDPDGKLPKKERTWELGLFAEQLKGFSPIGEDGHWLETGMTDELGCGWGPIELVASHPLSTYTT